MATSTYPTMTGAVGLSDVGTFIPELWSDEIRASYEKNLVLARLVKRLSMKGKKGDTMHIPAPVRGLAYSKTENTAVTLQNNTESEVTVVINNHYEYSRLIEDIAGVQALDSLRRFYTEDAGYALARQIDTDLFALGKNLGNGTGSSWVHSNSYYIDAPNGLSAYAASTVTTSDVFTDAGFRALIQLMDDADVPMDNRYFVIPPALRNAIMGIDRYVSSDFVNGRGVQNGKIGELYGIDIYVTSNCPEVETAAANTAGDRLIAAMLMHKDSLILAEQLGVRSQTQYKQEYLAHLYTADTLYGVKAYRPDSAFVLVVND
jgi:N4-gp56 family major capsid protein